MLFAISSILRIVVIADTIAKLHLLLLLHHVYSYQIVNQKPTTLLLLLTRQYLQMINFSLLKDKQF